MKTAQDSNTITIKQNVRVQEKMLPEKVCLDQIQNGRLSASRPIYFHMPDIW